MASSRSRSLRSVSALALSDAVPERVWKDLRAAREKGEWVLLENQTAADNNIPIIPFYDGDRWKWNDISFWVSKYPQFFKIPAIEYHRTYHKQSKALLVSKAKGQKRFSEQLVAPNEVVATAAQKLAVHMEELLTTQILPPQCAKLCRATSNLHDEAGSLAPELVEDAGEGPAEVPAEGAAGATGDRCELVPEAWHAGR